jgi:DNA-binding MarR family transcriptional regulator
VPNKTKKESEIENNLYEMPAHLIRRCHQICQGLFHEEFEKHGITPIQYAVLKLLSKHSGVEQITLAGLAALNRSTAGDVLKRMETAGLLERRESPEDRRVWLVHLTPAGQTVLNKVEAAVVRVQDRLLAPLNDGEREQFLGFLTRIADENNELSRAPLRARA